MAVEINAVFRSGGKQALQLLQYSVLSAQMDPLFLFLSGVYRERPTLDSALAIYELFCAPGAPARLSALAALPPRNLRLQQEMRSLCDQRHRSAAARDGAGDQAEVEAVQEAAVEAEPTQEADAAELELAAVGHLIPPRYLFDDVVRQLQLAADGPLQRMARQYDPRLTPQENLPDGRPTPAQRAFLDNVWTPCVRPRLVAAGFWRVASIG